MAYAEQGGRSLLAGRSREAAIALLLFIAALAYIDRTLHLTLELRDEGFLYYHIARVANGEIPHRDFIEVYGPGVYALTAPIFELFGERIWPVRILLALIRAGAVVLAYGIARRFVPRSYALLAAAFSLAFWGWSIWSLATPYATLFTIPLCMFSLYLLLIGESRGSPAAILASGFVCGFALLFKWSLAAMSAYGMVMAICAGAMLANRSSGDEPPPRAEAARWAVLLVWGCIASLVLVPFVRTLTPLDYLLHIGPIHGLALLTAIAFTRNPDGARAFRRAMPKLLRYCAGFAVAPLLTIAVYAAWGHADDLFYNTVTRPLNYRNYYMPIRLPPLTSVALLACGVALVTATLALIRRSYRTAMAFALLAAACAPFGMGGIATYGGVALSLEHLILQLPAITAYATLALIAVDIARRGSSPPFPLVAILLFQEMMSFQIYPRGSYNATLMLGTLAPIIAYLAWRWSGLATNLASPRPRLRSAVAFGLVAILPVLFVVDKVAYALTAPQPSDLPENRFRHPALAGIHPKPEAWERQDLRAFDELIGILEGLEPRDARIFVIHNEPMIYFLSEREPLFEDEMLIFFLAGWKLLPAHDRDTPSEAEMIARFDANPSTIVITRRGDKTAANLYAMFPSLRRYLARHYEATGRVGPYRVLRRIPER